MSKTREEYIKTGRRFHTRDVLREGRQALSRWEEDMDVLKGWGWGARRKARLEEALDALETRYQEYLGELGVKLTMTPRVHAAALATRRWCERCLSVLRDIIDTNQNVAKEIQALGSLPDANADGLLAFGNALMKIARANQSQLDEEIGLDGFFEAGQTTIDELKAAGISQRSTNEAKLTGTNEVDELDGRVHAIVRDLNHFARKALRDADKAERAQFYIFHHLTSRPSSNAPEPASPDTPTSDPAQG